MYGDQPNQIESVQVFTYDTIEKVRRSVISKHPDFASTPPREFALYRFPPVYEQDTLLGLLGSSKLSDLTPLRTGDPVSEGFASFEPRSLLHFVVVGT